MDPSTAKPESKRQVQFAATAKKEDGKKALGTSIRRFHHPTDPAERSKQIVEAALKGERPPGVVCLSSCEDGGGARRRGRERVGRARWVRTWTRDEGSVGIGGRRDDSDGMWELARWCGGGEGVLAART